MEPPGLRTSAIEWLLMRSLNGEEPLTREEIKDFRFDGAPFPIQSTQNGIRKPQGWQAALSVYTVFRTESQERPYADDIGPDGLVRYAWRGNNPNHPENVGLRRAMELQLPIVWFVGVSMSPARYQVVAPVYVIAEEPAHQRFVFAPVEDGAFLPAPTHGSLLEETAKRYLLRETKVRLHQPVFRSTVLTAYENHCAVCNLGHPQLLDAAHIVPDSDERGLASVVNGLAMCKIHHAAFDRSFLGITPDHYVEIRHDLLAEVDGPMLRHGLQELHRRKLMKLPTIRAQRPRRDLLELAYARFKMGSLSQP